MLRRPQLASLAALARSPAIWLAVLTFALYAPLALSVVQLSADVTEYIDLARRLAAGQGYQLGIKAYHIDGTAILHNGLDERAPLFPLAAAVVLRVGLGLAAVQLLNAAFAAGCVGLVYAIGNALFGRRTGLLAGLLAAFSPVIPTNMILPMSEAVAIFFTLLGTWLLIRDVDDRRTGTWLAAGSAFGLAYLARPTALPMAGAVVAGVLVGGDLCVRPRHTGPPLRWLLAFSYGLMVFVVPISLYSLAVRGSLSYSGQAYHYSVFHSTDVLRDANLQPLPTPLTFITANSGYVLSAMAAYLRAYAAMLFLDRRWLLLLGLAWPVAIYTLARRRYPRAALPVLLLALSSFFIYALTWASSYQPRYMLLTLFLLLPFAIDGLDRLGLGRLRLPARSKLTLLHIAVAGLVLFWGRFLLQEYRASFWSGPQPYASRTTDGLTWSGPSDWVEDPDLPALLNWISVQTGPDEALAYRDPWPLTFFTGRPSTLLPRRLEPTTLRQFLTDYRVSYVLQSRAPNRRANEDDLESLVAAGSPSVTIGAYRIFDTRSLWR